MTLKQADRAERDVATDETVDSIWPRMSEDLTRESGIPPPRAQWSIERTIALRSDEHAELALAESVRATANLNLLLRGLQTLTAGAEAARQANISLSHELDTLRELLARGHADEMALRHRVLSLEQTVDATKRDAARSRAFFIEQEDAFLRELLTDHECEIRDLKRQLHEALTRRDVKRARSETPSSGQAVALGSVSLRTVRVAATPSEGSETTKPPSVPPRPASRPPLRPKPELSLRPLVGYSLGSGEVAEERIEMSFDVTAPKDR